MLTPPPLQSSPGLCLPGVETLLNSYKPAPAPPKKKRPRSEKPFLLTVIALTWGAEDLKTGNHRGWGFVTSHIHLRAQTCTHAAHIRSRGVCVETLAGRLGIKQAVERRWPPEGRPPTEGRSQGPGEKGRVTWGPSHCTPEGPKAPLRPRGSGSRMRSAWVWSGRFSA